MDLTPTEDQKWLSFITGDGIKMAERMVTGLLAEKIVMIGEAAVEISDGTDGMKAEKDDAALAALKYKHFLEVLTELRGIQKRRYNKIQNQ